MKILGPAIVMLLTSEAGATPCPPPATRCACASFASVNVYAEIVVIATEAAQQIVRVEVIHPTEAPPTFAVGDELTTRTICSDCDGRRLLASFRYGPPVVSTLLMNEAGDGVTCTAEDDEPFTLATSDVIAIMHEPDCYSRALALGVRGSDCSACSVAAPGRTTCHGWVLWLVLLSAATLAALVRRARRVLSAEQHQAGARTGRSRC